jgi:hypothetical protein
MKASKKSPEVQQEETEGKAVARRLEASGLESDEAGGRSPASGYRRK